MADLVLGSTTLNRIAEHFASWTGRPPDRPTLHVEDRLLMDVIAIGDNISDCYLSIGQVFPGGNAVNVGVAAARAGVAAATSASSATTRAVSC